LDTYGQEQYHSVTKLFIQGSNIVLLIYSIDSKESLENLDFWYNTMKAILDGDNYIFAIIANKNDLKNNAVVSEEEGENMQKKKMQYLNQFHLKKIKMKLINYSIL